MTPDADAADAVVIGAPAPTVSSPPTCWPTPAGTCSCSRRSRTAGGAVATAEVTAPGFRNDLYSAFYPLARSPAPLARLDLEAHGLAWAQAPGRGRPPAGRRPGRRAVPGARGHGRGARRGRPRRRRRLAAPARPVAARGPAGAARPSWPRSPRSAPASGPWPASGPRNVLPLLRTLLLPVRRLGDEQFRGDGAKLLLAGNALHADVPPDAPPSGFLGWLLASLAQDVGFPTPVGGAGELAAALVRRLEQRRRPPAVRRPGRAGGGRGSASRRRRGRRHARSRARRAVLADVDAEVLLRRLVGLDHLPDRTVAALAGYQRSWATVKVDWALRTPDPLAGRHRARARAPCTSPTRSTSWRSRPRPSAARTCPTTRSSCSGQMTTADPTRSPPGTESAWAYTHVPFRVRDGGAGERRSPTPRSPGWSTASRTGSRATPRASATGSWPATCSRPPSSSGATPTSSRATTPAAPTSCTSSWSSARFRGSDAPTTPIRGLYLASASAHPGGGVHGACGANAARAVLAAHRVRRVVPFGIP